MVLSRKANGRKDGDAAAQLINANLLHRALAWAIDDKLFHNVPRHGNTSWQVCQLVTLAVLWVWSDHATLTGAFLQARELSLSMLGAVAVSSYQGLTGALVNWSGRLLPLLWQQLHRRMEQCGGMHWRLGPWLPLAVDGSRVTTPRTQSNEHAYGAHHYGHGRKAQSRKNWKNKRRRTQRLGQPVAPQIWLTLLWHMGLKMPWAWKIGPSTASERHHFLDLIRDWKFPEDTLFCGDAGFVGYELWQALIEAGHHFVVRVGANVRLLRRLGHVREGNGIVYLWPNEAARKQQPPLVLRLLEFQGERSPIALVTNVLSERDLSDSQARKLYRLRWGVELQFRAFKQTFRRSKLRSRTAANAAVELQWSLLGLWIIQLFAVKEQMTIASPPERSSVALAVAVIQDLMRAWAIRAGSNRQLRQRLREALKDEYRRRHSKQARYRPPCKDKPCAQRPVLVDATQQQRAAFRRLTQIAA